MRSKVPHSITAGARSTRRLQLVKRYHPFHNRQKLVPTTSNHYCCKRGQLKVIVGQCIGIRNEHHRNNLWPQMAHARDGLHGVL